MVDKLDKMLEELNNKYIKYTINLSPIEEKCYHKNYHKEVICGQKTGEYKCYDCGDSGTLEYLQSSPNRLLHIKITTVESIIVAFKINPELIIVETYGNYELKIPSSIPMTIAEVDSAVIEELRQKGCLNKIKTQ